MKKIIIGVLMSVMALSTFAQNQERVHKSPEEIAALRAERLKTELSLTEEQTKQVEAAFLLKMTKSKEIRTRYPNDKEAAKKELRPVHEQFKASMQEILSEEQFTQWKASKKKERNPKTTEEKAGMRAQQLKKSLNLTDEQTERVEVVILSKMTKAKEIKAKYPEDKESAKKEMRPIIQQFNAEMKEILTPEQFAQWQEMKKKHRGKNKQQQQQRRTANPVK